MPTTLKYFFETAGFKDHQLVLRQAVFFKEVLATVVAISGGKQEREASGRGSVASGGPKNS